MLALELTEIGLRLRIGDTIEARSRDATMLQLLRRLAMDNRLRF